MFKPPPIWAAGVVSKGKSQRESTPKALIFNNGTPQKGVPLSFMWLGDQSTFNAADEGTAFVACRWHELFDEFTPDTFHPKLFGIPSLVTEAITIGRLHDDHEAWGKHLSHVQKELSERLKRGSERDLCSPKHLGMIDRMSKANSPSDVVGAGRVLELESFEKSMEDAAIKRFSDLEFTAISKTKSEADEILSTLATYAFRKGCSADDCQEVMEMVGKEPVDVRQWVCAGLPSEESSYDCVVAVEAPDQKVVSAVRSVCEVAGFKRTGPKIPGIPKDPGRIYLQKSGKGLRPIDAVESIKTEIRSTLNLLALYQRKRAPSIRNGGWIIDGSGHATFTERSHSLRNLHPRRDATQLADKAVKALSGRNEPAILAALDLHNLALSMNDHRLRLVNLWSALECLGSIVEGGSIISKVERLVVPILTWRKIDKLVRYLAISLHLWLKANPQIDRTTLPFKLGFNDSVAPDQLLGVLAEEKDSPGIVALLSAIGDHPLLVYRVYRAWELLHDPKKLQFNLALSGERLGWHLWRIYRARNLVVHQGIEPPCLPQLANHLQQYFSTTLSRILHGITLGETWTSKDSWHYWRSQSEHVMDSLSKRPGVLRAADIFPEEIATPDLLIWPTSGSV